eukprot:scaffold4746_cov53-Attheya_sp.AAC.1
MLKPDNRKIAAMRGCLFLSLWIVVTAVPSAQAFFVSHHSTTNHYSRHPLHCATQGKKYHGAVVLNEQQLPTIEQLSSDPFMKQVGYAELLVGLLLDQQDDKDESYISSSIVGPLLEAQWSHSDGIRGFMVTYLTTNNNGNNEKETRELPRALQVALDDKMACRSDKRSRSDDDDDDIQKEDEGTDDFISLACMNVIMPTAMTTLHTDPALSEQSRRTSERATQILLHLGRRERERRTKSFSDNTHNSGKIQTQCRAIWAAASQSQQNDNKTNDYDVATVTDAISYWNKFFDNYGYQEQQRSDISDKMQSILTTLQKTS